jgi:hypothetical protein
MRRVVALRHARPPRPAAAALLALALRAAVVGVGGPPAPRLRHATRAAPCRAARAAIGGAVPPPAPCAAAPKRGAV